MTTHIKLTRYIITITDDNIRFETAESDAERAKGSLQGRPKAQQGGGESDQTGREKMHYSVGKKETNTNKSAPKTTNLRGGRGEKGKER